MENSVKQKSLRCIEWVVNAQSYELHSESFSFEDVQCNFQFTLGRHTGHTGYGYSASRLYLRSKSGSVFPSRVPVKVTIHITLNSNNLASQTSAIASFTEPIWTYSSGNLQGKLAVNMIIHNDSSKSDKSVQVSSYNDACFLMTDLLKDFSKLLDEGPNYDVEFVCGDQTVRAHKNVLCCRSDVFASMLQSDMVEGKTGKVKIEDMDVSVFRQFLRCLYTGMLPELTVDSAFQLYEAADKYCAGGVKKQCRDFLTDNLSPENTCEVLVLADRHNDLYLKKDVLEYVIKEKIPYVGEKWTDFCKANPILAVETLNLFCEKFRSKIISHEVLT